MAKILDQLFEDTPLTSVNIEEYDMAPAKDEHNDLGIEIVMFLRNILKNTDYKVKFDVYRYLQADLVNRFGYFKNGQKLERFVDGLKRFGASKTFIQKSLQHFAGLGVAQGSYAPDVFIIHKADDHNQFSIPLVVFEIISPNSLQNDLYYKPYFYETIGVQELFICQTTIRHGTIIRAFRLVANRYSDIQLEAEGYFSEVILNYIQKHWDF